MVLGHIRAVISKTEVEVMIIIRRVKIATTNKAIIRGIRMKNDLRDREEGMKWSK